MAPWVKMFVIMGYFPGCRAGPHLFIFKDCVCVCACVGVCVCMCVCLAVGLTSVRCQSSSELHCSYISYETLYLFFFTYNLCTG